MRVFDAVGNMFTSFPESFVKNVIMDTVEPKVGSILKVDLKFGDANHTGIYIGNNQVVELYNDDGIGKIRIVDPSTFLHGEERGIRTGIYIYCACKGTSVLCSDEIAERAKNAVGDTSRYSLFVGNCHGFTSYCITGKESVKKTAIALLDVELALEKFFNVSGITWRSTGREDFLSYPSEIIGNELANKIANLNRENNKHTVDSLSKLSNTVFKSRNRIKEKESQNEKCNENSDNPFIKLNATLKSANGIEKEKCHTLIELANVALKNANRMEIESENNQSYFSIIRNISKSKES